MLESRALGRRRRSGSRSSRLALAGLAAGALLGACSLHVSGHGVSGSVFGHHFSAASGALPSGFPTAVPVPDNSRVLGGGGAENRWDVAFAVVGTVTAGTAAYQVKLKNAGFTISNVESGSATMPSTAPPSGGSSQTTVSVSGSTFTASDATWTVQVASGTTSAGTGGVLKPNEFALNITVIPTSSLPAG